MEKYKLGKGIKALPDKGVQWTNNANRWAAIIDYI